jgi:hypothetical protein
VDPAEVAEAGVNVMAAAALSALALAPGLVGTAPVPAATPWLLLICGVGGDAAHRTVFDERAQTLMDAAVDQYGVAADRVLYLAERPAEVTRATARADAAGIAAAFAHIAAAGAGDDLVLVVLLGHGSDQGPAGRFNIVGPDLGPAEFATHLELLGERRIGFVNTTSASGGFLQLAAPGRVVITATGNLREREEPRFGEFFVDAFVGAAADLDKDGRVSLAEAFTYAGREVRRFYEDSGRLQPEHSMLVDSGAADGAVAELDDGDVGRLARQLALGGPAGMGSVDAGDTEMVALVAARATLQEALDALRAGKDGLDEEEYLAQLEDLLVEIAAADAAIRQHEGSQ